MPSAACPLRAARPRAALVVLAAGEGRRVGHHTNKVLLPLAGPPGLHLVDPLGPRSCPQVCRTGAGHPRGGPRGRDGRRWPARSGRPRQRRRRRQQPPRVGVEGPAGARARHRVRRDRRRGDPRRRPAAGRHRGVRVGHRGGRAARRAPSRSATSGHLAAARRRRRSPTSGVVAVQTPQAFRGRAAARGLPPRGRATASSAPTPPAASSATPTSPVHCVPGDAGNIKITFPEDLFLAERLLAKAD